MKKLIQRIANIYIRALCKREYDLRKQGPHNERAAEYAFVFRQLARLWPKTVLDVGTGLTALPQLMTHAGFDVTAIDNMTDFWPSHQTNRHFHVIDDDIVAPKLNRQFDLLTCISVLEHVRDCDAAMASMARLSRPQGHIVLTFPYNETMGCPNVYAIPGSNAPKDLTITTRAYCRADLDRWRRANELAIVEQEYWEFFSGDYWTVGERISPRRVEQHERHHITCLLLSNVRSPGKHS